MFIVITDDFGFNRAKEQHNGNVDSWNEEKNDEDGVFIGRNEVDSSH